jgi:hypothetical protein
MNGHDYMNSVQMFHRTVWAVDVHSFSNYTRYLIEALYAGSGELNN